MSGFQDDIQRAFLGTVIAVFALATIDTAVSATVTKDGGFCSQFEIENGSCPVESESAAEAQESCSKDEMTIKEIRTFDDRVVGYICVEPENEP